ncbi:hypothetical protein CEXT_252141 [Caerostris extrusa]|uniref:Uncharacterized protein n=1 Tax=Caerostris extrusa TaxID=172846 RepID=A0AAV4Y6M3_CAEEX|nr:hypothetical protein CEXT_252141 [Caerostris extrusa]
MHDFQTPLSASPTQIHSAAFPRKCSISSGRGASEIGFRYIVRDFALNRDGFAGIAAEKNSFLFLCCCDNGLAGIVDFTIKSPSCEKFAISQRMYQEKPYF